MGRTSLEATRHREDRGRVGLKIARFVIFSSLLNSIVPISQSRQIQRRGSIRADTTSSIFYPSTSLRFPSVSTRPPSQAWNVLSQILSAPTC
jgi:hypothetical protein